LLYFRDKKLSVSLCVFVRRFMKIILSYSDLSDSWISSKV
jgi:hypothetical protein